MRAVAPFAPKNDRAIEIDADRVIRRTTTRPLGACLRGAAEIFADCGRETSTMRAPRLVDEIALRYDFLHGEFVELMAIAVCSSAPHSRASRTRCLRAALGRVGGLCSLRGLG